MASNGADARVMAAAGAVAAGAGDGLAPAPAAAGGLAPAHGAVPRPGGAHDGAVPEETSLPIDVDCIAGGAHDGAGPGGSSARWPRMNVLTVFGRYHREEYMNEATYLLWPPLLFGGHHLPTPLAAAVFDCGMECALCYRRGAMDDVANEELLIDMVSSLPVGLPASKVLVLEPQFREYGYRMNKIGDTITVAKD